MTLTHQRQHLLAILPPIQEEKLIEHSGKKDDWRDYSIAKLVILFEEERREFLDELTAPQISVKHASREAGDVANVLAMIVDKLQFEAGENYEKD